MNNFQKINIERLQQQTNAMDILIISCSDARQTHYWQQRLPLSFENSLILAVEEDWEGGAGNGLGTLYAFQQARELAKTKHGVDLLQEQRKGASIAIYHTAGKGMRLMPLTLSEFNNKSAVKLPGLINIQNQLEPITLLEAVIKQTSLFSSCRRGRLSVFWGDQIFIPSTSPDRIPLSHIEILVKKRAFPDQSVWDQDGLQNYGLVAIDACDEAKLLEKTAYPTLLDLIAKKKVSTEGGVGISLGSFSLSLEMTQALLEEFKGELCDRKGKLDTDTGFWMALTLDLDLYLKAMETHAAPEFAYSHYQRMQSFKQKFLQNAQHNHCFGYVDIGSESLWWDYGTTQSYYQNALKLLCQTDESELMKLFFNLKDRYDPRTGSIVFDSTLENSQIENSVVIGFKGKNLNLKNSLLINSTLDDVKGENCLIYNAHEGLKDQLSRGQIRSDVLLLPKHRLKMYTHLDRDGKTDWKTQLDRNAYSYESVHQMIKQGQS